MSRVHDDRAASALDELFAHAEQMQARARASLGKPPVGARAPVEEPPVAVRDRPAAARPAAPDIETLLLDAANTALGVRDTDGVLVRIFGSSGATRGLSGAEASIYEIGLPSVGPHVRALATAYEPDTEAAEGARPLQTSLAVPILSGGEAIGILSIFSRSAEVVFDEAQGWELQAIAAWVAEGLEGLRVPIPAPVSAARTASPLLRTALLFVAGAACLAAPTMMITGIHSPVRVAAALALLTLAPGAALWPFFGSRSAPLELGLVIGASLGASALVAELMLWAGVWSPVRATAGLAAVSLASILVQLGMRRQRPRVAWSET